MKVSIIVGGRFHAFDLAEQLQKQGLLYQLVTTYPKSKVQGFDIDEQKLITFPLIEYFKRGIHKFFGFYPLNFFLSDLFDKMASKKIKKDADVYIIWAGMGLHTINRIRKENPKAKIILERGSTHIVEQNELLKKISKKDLVDKRTIKKETQEYDLVDFISVPSSFAKNGFLKNKIQEDKLFVNFYGVDLEMFYPKERCLNNNFTVGYAGTLSAQKNITGIINSVEKLIGQELNIKLKLVGNIDNKTFDKKELKKDFINYKSAVPQKELNEFYNKIDIFVLNSIQDGFGMVILQALSCGIPVIATKNTGGADVIKGGENGFIIPTFSEEDLVKKIELIYNLNEDKQKEMRKNAVKSVKSGFTWNDYGDRYVKFLKSIIK